MSKRIVGDVSAVAIAGVGRSVASAGEGLGFGGSETLTFKEESVRGYAQRNRLEGSSVWPRCTRYHRLEAIIVESRDGGDQPAGRVLDRWVGFVGAVGLAIQLVAVNLYVEGLFDRACRALHFHVEVVFSYGQYGEPVRRQEILYCFHFLRGWAKAGIELVLRDPLLVIGRALLSLAFDQLVQLSFIMELQLGGD